MEQRFELENFAGPLDLLLYLVQKEEVDIREVSLVRICDQYLASLRDCAERDIDLAGEFFVMAATLMMIKARSLLPQEEVDLAKELDPEAELLQQLLEYRQFKEASRFLVGQEHARTFVHPSNPAITDAGIPMEELDLVDLVGAFRQVLQETGLDRTGAEGFIQSDRPVSAYIQDMLERLHEEPRMSFFDAFRDSVSRYDLVGYFLAILELIRFRVITVRQPEPFGDIRLEALGEVPDSLTSMPEPITSDRPAAAVALPETEEDDSEVESEEGRSEDGSTEAEFGTRD